MPDPYLDPNQDPLYNPARLPLPPFSYPGMGQMVNPGVGVGQGTDLSSVAPLPSPPPPTAADANDPLTAAQNRLSQTLQKQQQVQAGRPAVPTPKWWQKLGAVAAGALAGSAEGGGYTRRTGQLLDPAAIEQGIVAPGYGLKQAQYKQQLDQATADVAEAQKNLQLQSLVGEQGARGKYMEGMVGSRDEATRQRAAAAQDKMIQARGGVPMQINDPVPQGWTTLPHSDNPNLKYALPPAFKTLDTPDMLKDFPGMNLGDPIPWADYQEMRKARQQAELERVKAGAKPPTAEQSAQKAEQSISKMIQAGELSLPDSQDMSKILAAAATSKALAPNEKADLASNLAYKSTNVGTTAAGVKRMQTLQENRLYGVIDTTTGQLQMLNGREANRMDSQQPGRFVLAQQGTPIMQKQATFNGMHYTVSNAVKAIQNVPNWGPDTQAKLAAALSEPDARTGVMNFIKTFTRGQSAQTLSPQERDLTTALRLLSEDMMSLRSVQGMGQGSETQRQQILQAIPGAFSPDKAYALQQMNLIDGLITNLEEGVPGLGRGNKKGGGGAPAAPLATPARAAAGPRPALTAEDRAKLNQIFNLGQ